MIAESMAQHLKKYFITILWKSKLIVTKTI